MNFGTIELVYVVYTIDAQIIHCSNNNHFCVSVLLFCFECSPATEGKPPPPYTYPENLLRAPLQTDLL